MVKFNEFFKVFNEFGLKNIVFLVRNNPHPNNNQSRDSKECEGIDLSALNTNDNDLENIDDVILSSGDVLAYNSLENAKDGSNEYLNRFDLEIITPDYDKRLANGECFVLLYNNSYMRYELYQITKQILQPEVKSSVYLWGTYKKNITEEEIEKIEKEKKIDIIYYLSNPDLQ